MTTPTRARGRRRLSALVASLFAGLLAACGETATTATGPTNAIPVAQAGADLAVSATLPVTLDASASTDADGDALTYGWSLTTVPAGSQAALDDPAAAQPTFTPDVPGPYNVQLVVNDGTVDSAPDAVAITALDNTASALIGPAGGSVTSTDGAFTLDVPAGALASDEQISITAVPVHQRPNDLTDLTADAVVYDMQPDGLTFAAPVAATVELPATGAPDAPEISYAPAVMATLSGGVLDLARNQSQHIDVAGGIVTTTAEIDHFSNFVFEVLQIAGGTNPDGSPAPPLALTLMADPPLTEHVGAFFSVNVDLFAAADGALERGTVEATISDASRAPVSPEAPLVDEVMTQWPQTDGLFLESRNGWKCDSEATGTWGADVTMSIDGSLIRVGLQTPTTATHVVTVGLARPVECVQLAEPFQGVSLQDPEGMARVGFGSSVAVLWAAKDGALVTDGAGRPTLQLVASAAASVVSSFAVVGDIANGALTAGDDGVRRYQGPLPIDHDPGPDPTPTADLEPVVVPPPGPAGPASSAPRRVPDFSAHATDVVTFGGGTTDVGAAAVLFGDRNLAFFRTGTSQGAAPGWVFDASLADAFKDTNGSVFGNTRPVSAWVGPNGFDADNPMLVVTIDDAIQSSELWKVELVAGKAQLTAVTNVSVADEARRVRCLDGICAVTAYGSAFGFGSTTLFQWDGQDTFTPITSVAGRAIGVDLIRTDRNSVLIGTTSFLSNAYSVYEVSTAGQLVGSGFQSVPQGCTGPGHVLFRSQQEVILSCNTSDNAVSDDSFTIS